MTTSEEMGRQSVRYAGIGSQSQHPVPHHLIADSRAELDAKISGERLHCPHMGEPTVEHLASGSMTKLLTESETADLLQLTSRQVLRLARRGELPSVRFPNAEVRFDPDDIRRFVESHKQPVAKGVVVGGGHIGEVGA